MELGLDLADHIASRDLELSDLCIPAGSTLSDSNREFLYAREPVESVWAYNENGERIQGIID